MAAGYSFEALRAKILFSEGVLKIKRPTYRQRRKEPAMEDLMVMRRAFPGVAEHIEDENPTYYGTDLSTLTRQIVDGDI